MFVSEQSGNFDKGDQWIVEKCLGEVVLKADSRPASRIARERSWQSPVLTAEVGKNPEWKIVLPSMKLRWENVLPHGFHMPFLMESKSSPGRIDTFMQSYLPTVNETSW